MTKKAKQSNTIVPSDFCEHERHPCLFCGKLVRVGHEADGTDAVIHERPSCPEFQLCDDFKQFAMLSALKLKTELGRLERN